MVQINFAQSVVTGIGPAATIEELNKTKNVIVKVQRGQYTNNPELATITNYLNDTTQQPYQVFLQRVGR